jgi:hypothetical protein
MALPVLAPVLRGVVVDAAIKAGQSLWTQMPWAKDQSRVTAVEARIRRLASDAADLARSLTDEALEPGFERLLDSFERDVRALGLTAAEATSLSEIENEQLRSTILEAAVERRQMQKWLNELEARATRAEAAAERQGDMEQRFAALERRLFLITVALAVSLTLGLVATLLSVLFFTRR